MNLTNADKDLLLLMKQCYLEYLDKLDSGRGDYMALAHEVGEIGSAGDKYTDNIRFFDVNSTIKKHLQEKRTIANQLINKLL